ncbi:uncharacterized protein BJ212DRAFT_1337263 [Suillus subaureus]|uniref:Uncharacterized protein n=1 Tax=Suillus subaureus TaxID=48587 RepID=A0A9P7EGE9_9AGAM|nr:uncharacterized protein BJ212DRAFT_1337263 [Suillus subaureus]KAG1821076.1 hypothetical protein BJ212DRAFT_1337263 [Suillus subaureus]
MSFTKFFLAGVWLYHRTTQVRMTAGWNSLPFRFLLGQVQANSKLLPDGKCLSQAKMLTFKPLSRLTIKRRNAELTDEQLLEYFNHTGPGRPCQSVFPKCNRFLPQHAKPSHRNMRFVSSNFRRCVMSFPPVTGFVQCAS